MDRSKSGKKLAVAIVLICILFGVTMCVVATLVGPSIIARVRSAIALNPDNFRDANVEFFQRLSQNEIEILSFSLEESIQVDCGGVDVAVIPLTRDNEHIADQDNKKAHANDAVLVYACYEIVHGNKKHEAEYTRILGFTEVGRVAYNLCIGPFEAGRMVGNSCKS